MDFEIQEWFASLYREGIGAKGVLKEAISNAVHANATEIEINLAYKTDTANTHYLEKVVVTDNGDGFTEENLNSFSKPYSKHKKPIGGKGLGRFSFLKYAQDVKIKSQTNDFFIKEFDFNLDFDISKLSRLPQQGKKQTVITLSKLKKDVNTQVKGLVESLWDDLKLLFFLKKQKNQNIVLIFNHDAEHKDFPQQKIYQGQDISPVKEGTFTKSGGLIDSSEFKFFLFKETGTKINAMLCAHDVCVETVPISPNFDTARYSIFVTSDLFDQAVDMERKKMTIEASRYEELIDWIKDKGIKMISEVAPDDIEAFKEKSIAQLKKYYPYINPQFLTKSGFDFIDVDAAVKKHRKDQETRESKIHRQLENGEQPDFGDLSHLAKDDLTKYIVHRAFLIDSLINAPKDKKSFKEEFLHNAILPSGDSGNSFYTNNIWLIDDKFLSYSSVHSNKWLSTIVREVTDDFTKTEGLQDRPDVAIFFTESGEKEPSKLVVVELKKPAADFYEKTKGLTQCRKYANELVNKIPSVLEVFSFAIVDIDESFSSDLKQTNYKNIFSSGDNVFYNSFSVGETLNVPLHQYVMSLDTLLKDAKSRNKVFEDILQLRIVDNL